MACRTKHAPLSETTFYTLLVLDQPAHGYLIMQRIRELSNGLVDIAAGTMYGILDNLLKQNYIDQVCSEDSRRRVYAITEKGKHALALDIERINRMIDAAKRRSVER